MNLWFRLLWLLLRQPFRPRIGALDTSELDLRVWPSDLDPNLHMNNGRYLALMDLGRLDLVMATGLGRVCWRRGWRPVAGAISIRFRRPLNPFVRFSLKTRILGWDEKWFYLEQVFAEPGGEVAQVPKGVDESQANRRVEKSFAQAVFRGLFLDRRGRVPSQAVMEALDFRAESPTVGRDVLERLGSAPMSQ